MQKVGSVTDTADQNGEFTNGNVAQGVVPTVLLAEIFNTWQRELVNVVEGSGMTLDPNDYGQILKAINKSVGGGRLLSVKAFSSSGMYTPTLGTKSVRVKVWGGGAGGQGMAASDTVATSGAAGAYAESFFALGAMNAISITVGSGGSSVGAGSSAYGGSGGTSSFGGMIICTGGSTTIAGTFGGVASGGNVFNINGQGGQGGRYIPAISQLVGGFGGCAYSSYSALPHISIAGDNGGYPGGGGAVGSYAGSSEMYASGAGANGFVIVEEYT
ncbi:hypothetical protein [Serratia fonticola]|uniref:glycine-rich domain-containing protein n=1 Tax=Serratia fonticola TaxID=47917 RepID=UPI0009401236|nr:hypothetical protein [Serratia fonticola]OKP27670.1 hypothetical protein BSQ40_15075 [Serratia fonticola]